MQELKTYYYQDGNTVRVEQPVRRPSRNLPTREQRERERREAAERRQHITERRRIAAYKRNKLLSTYMILAVAVTCVMLVIYVSMQNNLTTRMNHVAALENQLSELNADNNATESRIATTTNLSEIKDKAMNELGMVYANSDQIVYYSIDSSDYMNQYHDIP